MEAEIYPETVITVYHLIWRRVSGDFSLPRHDTNICKLAVLFQLLSEQYLEYIFTLS
jgi:hypothetical protein